MFFSKNALLKYSQSVVPLQNVHQDIPHKWQQNKLQVSFGICWELKGYDNSLKKPAVPSLPSLLHIPKKLFGKLGTYTSEPTTVLLVLSRCIISRHWCSTHFTLRTASITLRLPSMMHFEKQNKNASLSSCHSTIGNKAVPERASCHSIQAGSGYIGMQTTHTVVHSPAQTRGCSSSHTWK